MIWIVLWFSALLNFVLLGIVAVLIDKTTNLEHDLRQASMGDTGGFATDLRR